MKNWRVRTTKKGTKKKKQNKKNVPSSSLEPIDSEDPDSSITSNFSCVNLKKKKIKKKLFGVFRFFSCNFFPFSSKTKWQKVTGELSCVGLFREEFTGPSIYQATNQDLEALGLKKGAVLHIRSAIPKSSLWEKFKSFF